MAHHLVHRGAHRLREGIVVQRARVRAALDGRLVDNAVELVGRHAGAHRPRGLVQDFPAYPARRPGFGDLALVPDRDGMLLLGLLLGERDRRRRVIWKGDALGDSARGPDLFGAELARPGEGGGG